MQRNADNPHIGKVFQETVKKAAERMCKCTFEDEVAIKIGSPPTAHKFDLVSSDGHIIIECKCYTWTKSGNVPSAKLATLDEAVLYLINAPKDARKIIAMKKDVNNKNGKTLASYYVEKKRYLLGDIEIWEVEKRDNSDQIIITVIC